MGPHNHRASRPRARRVAGAISALALAAFAFTGCAGDTRHRLLISTRDQQMTLFRDGEPVAFYPVSTSKFGVGNSARSNQTPDGLLKVRTKIGGGTPSGTVFKSRKPTGEILPVNAPGRDPIVTRILWLDGLEPQNRNAYGRYIYIHGTPEERTIGTPASYGCIRMKSSDVIELFDTVGVGARVEIRNDPPQLAPSEPPFEPASPVITTLPPPTPG